MQAHTFPLHDYRKFHHIVLSVVICTLTISLLSCPITARGGVKQWKDSPQLRAMEAAKQLREFRQQETVRQHKARQRGLSAAPADVSLRVDRSIQSSSTIHFYDNMESGINGWTTEVYSGADLWHQVTSDASSPTHSWWIGIDGQGNYQNGLVTNTALKSPTIDLSAATAPVTMLFAESFATEKGHDFCMVDVSTNGGSSWAQLRGGYGGAPSGNTNGWRFETIDLSAYAGSQINIRFYFSTGDTLFNEFPGWFVDDVVIFDQGGRIAGRKFFDVNNNGVKDLGERGIKEWTITATGGPISMTTKTNYRGRYVFTLPLGSYTVSETPRVGWIQTYPLGGTWSVNLITPDTLVDSMHFGNWTQASFINGIKYDDINRNGLKDGADSNLTEWTVTLSDTLGNLIDYDKTDSVGEYSLYVFETGRYVIEEEEKSGWYQTQPGTGSYIIDIPNLITTINNYDFGNYYSDSLNAIVGQKFNDLNRNGLKDTHEPGVPGFLIRLQGPYGPKRMTDSSGYYKFLSLLPGTYKVLENQKDGWWQSYPESSYTITMSSGELYDSVDFGNYEIGYSSISGMKFNDENDNGIKDSNEVGLSGWTINLGGKASASTTTDINGSYSFPNLWPGQYFVSEVWRSEWRQTYPASLASHNINLGPEQNLGDIDFGNIQDSTFSTMFRSFLPESLALARNEKGKHEPIKLKANKVEFSFLLQWRTGSLKLKFPMLTSGSVRGENNLSAPVLSSWNNLTEVTIDESLLVGNISGVVRVDGFGFKGKPIAVKYRFVNSSGGVIVKGVLPSAPAAPVDTLTMNILRLPMPSAINGLQVMGSLGVGLGGPHSVFHLNYKDVMKSLIEKGDRMHTGGNRCLNFFEGPKPRSIKKQQKALPPAKHNNKLFAEAIALKANIKMSDLGITPPGFGNLTYDEGTGINMPINNMSLREIANLLDQYMSSHDDSSTAPMCEMPPVWLAFQDTVSRETLYTRLRWINGAFSGVLDTTSFASGVKFTGVRGVEDVPFLRYDTSSAMRYAIIPRYEAVEQPQQFTLYQNYPNPFNPTTTIEFYLTAESFVTLRVYNALGQEVATLADKEIISDGWQELNFDAASLSSGVYFYRIVAETIPDEEEGGISERFVSVKKMLLVK